MFTRTYRAPTTGFKKPRTDTGTIMPVPLSLQDRDMNGTPTELTPKTGLSQLKMMLSPQLITSANNLQLLPLAQLKISHALLSNALFNDL